MAKQNTDTPTADKVAEHKTCVVVPTTGGMVWVRGLKKRPRLKSSYCVMEGDFRPLKLSKDYHHFVAGPLTQVQNPPQIYELALSDNIDSGRSWEFPTLITHLLETQGQLSFADPSTLEKDGDPGCNLIWATGSLDQDLAPVAADYKLLRKLELSRPVFEKCAAQGHHIRIFLCAGQPAEERAAYKEVAKEFGADYYEITTFKDLTTALGIDLSAESTTKSTTAELTNSNDSTSTQPIVSTEDSSKNKIHKGLLAGTMAALGALLLWAGLSFFGSGSSTYQADPEANAQTAQTFTLEELIAKDQSDCRKRIMMADRFDTRALPFKPPKGFQINSRKELCGFRVRNIGTKAFRLQLSEVLKDYSIRGNNSLYRGRELRAGKASDLYLSRLPVNLRAQLTLTLEEARKSRFFIEFSRPTPGG
ncbi:MAG: hypothetical protein L3J67_13100 [Hyphomicrobiaceae bacterium]|nr:hypothetical protein [Hyphomicrobiaceae bacterium]